MSVPVVTLKGKGLLGIQPVRRIEELAGEGPIEVKLGRIRPVALPQTLMASSYIDLKKVKKLLPDKVDYYTKAQEAIAQMYGNDQAGDCVIASAMHIVGAWTGADTPKVATGTTKEALDQYHQICGAGDNGCYIDRVNDWMIAKGLIIGGKVHKIDGYISLDWTKKDLAQAACHLFGNIKLGVNLPSAWTSSDVWDVTSTRIVGGHDIPVLGYNTTGPVISSWGRIYQMTWAAFLSKKYVDEAYVLLGPDWYNDDNLAPSGVDVTTLKADLKKLSSGVVPEVDPTPAPPNPVEGKFTLAGTLRITGATMQPGAWKLSMNANEKLTVGGTFDMTGGEFTGKVIPLQ